MRCLAWCGGHRHSLLLSGLLSAAYGDGCVESEVLLLEEVLNSVSIQEALDESVTDVLLSEQNLQVLASSRRLTRKLSKVSPGCCVQRRKVLLSTDSLMWPST